MRYELIFFMSAIHYSFDMLFDMLEAAVNNNLFRLMGLGLIFLGAYPFFDSNNIDRRNGTFVILIGILLLLRGLVDITDLSYRIFYTFFAQFDSLFAIFVVIGLALVILNILIGSGNLKESTTNLMDTHKPKLTGARKIDTSFIEEDSSNQGKGHNEHIESNLRDNSQNNDYLDDSENHYQDTHVENHYQDAHADNQENQEQLPLYEEEIILVNNPEDPENPIKKRILKRVKRDSDLEDDDYEDMYILDEVE